MHANAIKATPSPPFGSQTSRNITELHEFLDQNGMELKAPDVAERYGIIVSDLRKKGTPHSNK